MASRNAKGLDLHMATTSPGLTRALQAVNAWANAREDGAPDDVVGRKYRDMVRRIDVMRVGR